MINVNLKQDLYAAAQAGAGLAVVALMLMGIAGTIYKVISPDGWIANAFSRSFSVGAAALGSLLMIAALAWFSRGWSAVGARNRFSNFFVYAFAAAGILYFARLWLKGTF